MLRIISPPNQLTGIGANLNQSATLKLLAESVSSGEDPRKYPIVSMPTLIGL